MYAELLVENVPAKLWEDENVDSLETTLEEWVPVTDDDGDTDEYGGADDSQSGIAADPCKLMQSKRIEATAVRCTLRTTARSMPGRVS